MTPYRILHSPHANAEFLGSDWPTFAEAHREFCRLRAQVLKCGGWVEAWVDGRRGHRVEKQP